MCTNRVLVSLEGMKRQGVKSAEDTRMARRTAISGDKKDMVVRQEWKRPNQVNKRSSWKR